MPTILPDPLKSLAYYNCIAEAEHEREETRFRPFEVLKYCLRDAVYLADPKLQEYMFIDPANEMDTDPFTKREARMGKAILRMMKRIYLKNDEKILPILESASKAAEIVPTSMQVWSFLRSRLKDDISVVDCPSFATAQSKKSSDASDDDVIEQVLKGRTRMPYQRYVLASLVYAGKFMARCMERFEYKQCEIFDDVLKNLEDFYEDQNVLPWIEMCARSDMDPFGKPGLYVKSQIEDDSFCCGTFESRESDDDSCSDDEDYWDDYTKSGSSSDSYLDSDDDENMNG